VSARTGTIRAAAASLLLLSLLGLSWWGGLDQAAAERTHAAFQRALVTFALTRTLNGVISVAQGTELAFQPAGVGVVLSAGEILDPLNDLVEQFSWLTLLAATSLGLQIMLGEMFATVAVNVVLSAAIIVSIVLLWWQAPGLATLRPTVLRLTAAFIFLRFAIAMATLGTGYVNEHFLTPRENASVAFLSRTSADIESASTTPATPGTTTDSVLERLNQFIDDQRQALDIERRLSQLKTNAETAVEQVVNLIVVYIIETLLLPLGFLVVAWGLVKQTWRRIT
jgi:hypothetical protein